MTDLEVSDDRVLALPVIRRGVRTSPELRRGLVFTALMALAGAVGKLSIPILIQQVLERAILDVEEFDGGVVLASCALALAIIAAVAVVSRLAYLRLIVAAEGMLYRLRTEAFAHIHRLSVADHNESRRGDLTARVTSDIEIIARFAQWAGLAWIVNSIVILGALLVMLFYSWQLTIVTIVAFLPVLPGMRFFQRRQLAAYGQVRNRVGVTLGEISETVQGINVIRAYGLDRRARRRLDDAITDQYQAEMSAAKYFALLFPMSDLFGGIALTAVVTVGVWWGPGWGLSSSTLVAFIFLVGLVLNPVAELGEVLDQTQQGIAGWARVFELLDQPVEIEETTIGPDLPTGALAVGVRSLSFSYRTGGLVLRNVDLDIAAGTSVAVVGETGSGKTTFAKLLARLTDPTEGEITVGDVPLRLLTKDARTDAIRMVPQDGFLFSGTISENVRFGRSGASAAEAAQAFASLGLDWWVEGLPNGLDTDVGERGDNLSVGERQLVALARAQLADPGILILDEATSAVDPETERALSEALRRLTRGRTTISVAHRLSTAELADRILVFDHGELVEDGSHADLVAARGRYAGLYESWLGNTRTTSRA